MTAACVGQWELFDSTDPVDHIVAAAICAQCPMILACYQQLQAARAAALGCGPSGGPRGTWAGRLVGDDRYGGIRVRRSIERITAEEEAFTERDCLDAKAAYERGDRSDWVLAGKRTYERRRPKPGKRVSA